MELDLLLLHDHGEELVQVQPAEAAEVVLSDELLGVGQA